MRYDVSMKLVTIARCRQGLEANLIKGFLESEQISAVVTNEHLVGINWLYSDAVGGVEVRVETSDADSAISLLRDGIADLETDHEADAADGVEADALDEVNVESTCLECGSTKVAPRPGSIFKALWAMLIVGISVVEIPMLIVALPLAARPRRQRCQDCGRWSLQRG